MSRILLKGLALAAIIGAAGEAGAQSAGNPHSIVIAQAPPSGTSSEASPAAPTTSPAFDPRQIEMVLWQEAQRGNTAREYQAYLDAYPSGIFAGIARARIDALKTADVPVPAAQPSSSAGASTSTPPPRMESASAPPLTDARQMPEATEAMEENMDLSSKAWRDIQGRLTALGFYKRSIDGEAGPGTRKAVSDWQRARGYPISGFLNDAQHRALLAEPVTTTTASGTSSSGNSNSQAQYHDSFRCRCSPPAGRATAVLLHRFRACA